MKKHYQFCFFLLFPVYLQAQNVGIGTTTPLEKLEVKHPLRSTVRISSNSLNDTTELLLSNRTSGNTGTDFSLKSIREDGLFFSSLSDLPANNNSNSLVIKPNGNIGIGVVPTYKLHVNGTTGIIGTTSVNGLLRLEGLNLFEFGAGVAGKEVNAGKIGYNAFGQNALTFVGAGTNAGNRAVYFFAEGGTTMSGSLNIGGPLMINNNSGTTGQVLASNGTAAPVWTNAALSNNTRFSTDFTNGASETGSAVFVTPHYNLNTTNVVFSAANIGINKTGLYHFDLMITAEKIFTINPASNYPRLTITMTGTGIDIFNRKEMHPLNDAKLNWIASEVVSFDLQINAGTNLSLFHTLGSAIGSTFNIRGTLSGYLISE